MTALRALAAAAAVRPARLPAIEADLDAWRVYADKLMALGEPRGTAMALDLALPADSAEAQRAGWLAAARPWCRRGKQVALAWCLAHVRTLTLVRAWVPSERWEGPEIGALARAHAIVTSPLGGCLEEIAIEYRPGQHRRHWRRLLAALPRSCERVTLGLASPVTAPQLDELLGWLPPHVRTLRAARRLGRRGELTLHVVRPRFELVDLSAAALEPAQLAELARRLGEPDAPAVRVANLTPALLGAPRCTLGGPGAAALVLVATREALALPRWTALAVQNRHGLVPLRAQWAGALAEGYEVLRAGLGLVISPPGRTLLRRGAIWTASARTTSVVFPGGSPFGAADWGEVPDGTWLQIGGVDALLFARDAETRARGRIAQLAM